MNLKPNIFQLPVTPIDPKLKPVVTTVQPQSDGSYYVGLLFAKPALLKVKIENYKQTIDRLSPNVDLNNLNTNKIMVYGEQVDWAISNFEKLPLPLVIYNLIRIELSIKAVESAALFQIQ